MMRRAFLSEMIPLIERGGGTVEYRFRHRDGHYIWIQDTFKVVYDDDGNPLELVGAWADITESKHAEQAALEANTEMQETKRYLARLIESSPDAIIATDKEGNVVLFNEGAETLLGYQRRRRHRPPHKELYDSEGARQGPRASRCGSAAAPPLASTASSRRRTGTASLC